MCVRSLLQGFVSVPTVSLLVKDTVQSILYLSCFPEAKGIDDKKTDLGNATNPDLFMFQDDVALK